MNLPCDTLGHYILRISANSCVPRALRENSALGKRDEACSVWPKLQAIESGRGTLDGISELSRMDIFVSLNKMTPPARNMYLIFLCIYFF